MQHRDTLGATNDSLRLRFLSLLAVLLLSLGTSELASAQDTLSVASDPVQPSVRIGAVGGLTRAGLYRELFEGRSLVDDEVFGFNAGLTIQWLRERTRLSAEVALRQKGQQFGGEDGANVLRLWDVTLEGSFAYVLTDGPRAGFLFFGPRLDVLVSKSLSDPSNDYLLNGPVTSVFGMAMGVGADLSERFTLEFRYDLDVLPSFEQYDADQRWSRALELRLRLWLR